jgi:aminopeptidase N
VPAADGRLTHAFTLGTPAPPFMFGFAAGHFAEAALQVGRSTLRALGPAGADLEGALARTAPMLAFLEEKTGAPLPSREYTQVFVAGDAAQEEAGLAFLSADSLTDVEKDPSDDWLFLHELAHQWFGVKVPCADFAHFWLNEGFATFFTGVWKQARWGQAAWETEFDRWKARSAKAHAEGRDAPIALAKAPPESQLQARAITYSRGALVLQRLREELGEESFWAGLARYVAAAHPGGAHTDELRTALEAASGKDLKPFFARWLTQAAPEL